MVLSGLVVSVGGLQDSLRKASVSSLLEYIQESGSDGEHRLCGDFLWILQQNRKYDRIIIPTMKVLY